MIRVLNVLIVSFVDRDEPVVTVFDTEYLEELVLDVLRESRDEELRVLIKLYHVLLVKRRPFVLLECIIVATLFATHLAVELVFS